MSWAAGLHHWSLDVPERFDLDSKFLSFVHVFAEALEKTCVTYKEYWDEVISERNEMHNAIRANDRLLLEYRNRIAKLEGSPQALCLPFMIQQ